MHDNICVCMLSGHFVDTARAVGGVCQDVQSFLGILLAAGDCRIPHLSHHVLHLHLLSLITSLMRALPAASCIFSRLLESARECLEYTRRVDKHVVWELQSYSLPSSCSYFVDCSLYFVCNEKLLIAETFMRSWGRSASALEDVTIWSAKHRRRC